MWHQGVAKHNKGIIIQKKTSPRIKLVQTTMYLL